MQADGPCPGGLTRYLVKGPLVRPVPGRELARCVDGVFGALGARVGVLDGVHDEAGGEVTSEAVDMRYHPTVSR